jgi:hypothetical protein
MPLFVDPTASMSGADEVEEGEVALLVPFVSIRLLVAEPN